MTDLDNTPNDTVVDHHSGKNDPNLIETLTSLRLHLHATLAQVVLAMMSSPRYKHFSIADLQQLALEPLLRDRIAVATTGPKPGAVPTSSDGQTIGIAIWAKVSPEVDSKIREQIRARVFPLRLGVEDWASGEIAWLLDVIAPTRQQAVAIVSNIRKVVKDGQLLVHPALRGLIEPDLLKAPDAKPGPNELAEAAPGS